MNSSLHRRVFLQSTLGPAVAGLAAEGAAAQSKVARVGGPSIKLSCNVFSFNGPLSRGDMTLDDVFEFCAKAGFAAVDPTGYYFGTYPRTPADDYVYHLKKKAFLLGLDISGTGVRNDFTQPEPEKRAADVELVADWVRCAAKLGAPLVRVFSGKGVPAGHTADETYGWVADGIRRCVEVGKQHGVMIALQNHADLLLTAGDVLRVLRDVDSDWFGMNLDIGSFRTQDPYEDIARIAPYAVTWQIKEQLEINGRQTRTDLKKIAAILKQANYRGYIPLEILEGDARERLPRFIDEVRAALA
jgi:sugar phosphate isomerase/epimerase